MTILDASVATAWYVSIATSEAALPVRSRPVLAAPDFLKVELTSSLLKYVRVGMLDGEAVHRAVVQVGPLVGVWVADEALLGDATEIALAHNHKIYDCLYLALALRRREALATADRRLAALAKTLSIETDLIEPAL